MWYNSYFCIPLDKCKSRKKLARLENNNLFITTFMRLLSDAMNRYTIKNTPDTVNERVMLESLLVYGNTTLFEESGNVLALPSVPSGGGFNLYGDPVSAWVFSRNGLFNRQIDLYVEGGADASILNRGTQGIAIPSDKRGVMIWENKSRFPFLNTVIYYASVISDTLRTIDVDRRWLKRPFIPVCEESLVPSITKIFDEMADNNGIIPVSTGVLDIDRFDLKPVDVSPDIVKSAIELVEWYENKFRELCGTDSNTQVDKKGENLIKDEVHVNDEYTDKSGDALIECLNHYLGFANQQFGTEMKAERKEVKENGQSKDIPADSGRRLPVSING